MTVNFRQVKNKYKWKILLHGSFLPLYYHRLVARVWYSFARSRYDHRTNQQSTTIRRILICTVLSTLIAGDARILSCWRTNAKTMWFVLENYVRRDDMAKHAISSLEFIKRLSSLSLSRSLSSTFFPSSSDRYPRKKENDFCAKLTWRRMPGGRPF